MASGCCHHWIINGSEGRFAVGRCRHCGTERQFLNRYSTPPDEESDAADLPIEYQGPGVRSYQRLEHAAGPLDPTSDSPDGAS